MLVLQTKEHRTHTHIRNITLDSCFFLLSYELQCVSKFDSDGWIFNCSFTTTMYHYFHNI